MRIVVRIVKWAMSLVLTAMIGVFAWLFIAPPELIRVGTGYAAKIACSNHFLAGRDADEVLKVDVQAPGHPLLRLVGVSVDERNKAVSASLLAFFGTSRAVWHEGLGCTSVPGGGRVKAVQDMRLTGEVGAAGPDALWPAGERVDAGPRPEIDAILDDPALAGPGMRAIVVAQNGRIVAERYGAGFSAETPLLGWSMTKTVTAAIIGTLVGDGRMALDGDGLFGAWTDERKAITVADLMAMSSGLTFDEDYGDVTDVTRMLYLEPDMAAFAASKRLAFPVGSTFSYSSGTTVLLSRLWQDAIGDANEALAYPRRALFAPLGMRSAVLETDAHGTFAGSSYLYATPRDWTRFGQFLLQDGRWEDRQILPEGFAAWMREAAPASNGQYGRGQLWLGGPGGTDIDTAAGIPEDAFWLRGHDGQTMAIIPSRNLVVLRMGLTPSRDGYRPQRLVGAVAEALR